MVMHYKCRLIRKMSALLYLITIMSLTNRFATIGKWNGHQWIPGTVEKIHFHSTAAHVLLNG